jgi:hypothetical protein
MKGFFGAKNRMLHRLSREQLQKDFGEFPPHPLHSKSVSTGKFNIVYLNRIGKILFDLKSGIGLVRHMYNHPNDAYSSSMVEVIGHNVVEEIQSSYSNFLGSWNDLRTIQKIMMASILFLTAPISIPIVLYRFLKILVPIMNRSVEFKRFGGFFSNFYRAAL